MPTMTYRILTLTIAIAAMSASAYAASASLDSASVSFMKEAQQQALGAYAIASLAEKRASTSAIRNLAHRTVASTTQANNFLKQFALQHGAKLPNKAATLDTLQYSNLSGLHGSSFDARFLERIHMDALIAADTYGTYARSGRNPQLSAFAKHQLNTIQSVASQAGTLQK